jgi:hypothetical protein
MFQVLTPKKRKSKATFSTCFKTDNKTMWMDWISYQYRNKKFNKKIKYTF